MDFDATKRVLAALEDEQVNYAVFGGAALNLHGIARATEDLDLFIQPTVDNIEAMKRALKQVFDDPEIDEIDTVELIGDYPAVRYIPPTGDFFLDILTRLGEAYDFGSIVTERLNLDGLAVSVVTPQTLYEMKRDTVREQDRVDAERVRNRFELED